MDRRTDWFLMRINEREREDITALARREGVPAAQAVRKAIQQALREETDRAPAKAEACTVSRP